ncbi:PhyR family response regulator anti-anti-sigma factor [Henriciella pelagia]|uniref:Two-component response regulator n=1 Tax=Henriciella pelagia TaxID=1977912 RepID=A0ABQ1JMS9_9PROT|nr:response regulator [Henriciella pelagia]GGB72284.1 two-component response regulator [Henriciella pelagia]
MGIAEDVEKELPYLRRYARAVTGSSLQGDTLVEGVIVDLLERSDPGIGRLTLFSMLERKVSDFNASAPGSASPALSSNPRRAQLLTTMEGFTLEDAARIMGADASTVSDFVADAEDELKASLATDVFIIEDEALVAAHIAQIAKQMGHHIIGQAVTRETAVEACLANPPALLLADVQLADGSSGAEAAREITDQLDIPVIFITAYPQRLLKGERGEPAFLIPKPFRPDMVKAVISQALIQKAAKL